MAQVSGFLVQLTTGGAESIEADYFKETNDGAWMLFAKGAGHEVKRIKQEYIAVIETRYGEAAS